MEHLYNKQPHEIDTDDFEDEEEVSPLAAVLGGLMRGAGNAMAYRAMDKKAKKRRRSKKGQAEAGGCTPCEAQAYNEDLRKFAKSVKEGGL